MDIIKDIIHPQSSTNILLLKYLLFISLLILLPYLSVMIGSTLFSVLHFRKGNNLKNKQKFVFAKEMIDLFTINKSMTFSLGIVPLISITFIYGQLLYNSGISLTSNLFFALLLLITALIYIYTYKYTFKLKNLFNLINFQNVEDEAVVQEYEGLKNSNTNLLSKSGIIGLLLLFVVSYIVIGTLQISLDSARWVEGASLINIIFSVNTLLYFLFYISFSIAITSSVVIYKYFKSGNNSYDKEYLEYAKNFALKTGLIFTFIQPLLYVLTTISTPQNSLSFNLFVAVVAVLGLMLIISIVFYLMYKESKTGLGGSAVLLFLILTSVIIYKDQLAFDTTSQLQVKNLVKEHELYIADVKAKAGIEEIVEINGEDIYNAKCIACHKFDDVLVGPAYNDVLPKYEGKREDLVSFILNPVKVNPEFTAMPNQGLKPKEAEAIADYIVKIYQGN